MGSALRSVVNATVTFQVPTTGVRTDPDTGNVGPATKAVEMALFLKAAAVGQQIFPGVNVQDTVYEGYAVEPTAFDGAITDGTTGTLRFAGEVPVQCEVLELRLNYGNSGLIGGTLARVLGEKIRLVARKF
jgi:hypothetical protein